MKIAGFFVRFCLTVALILGCWTAHAATHTVESPYDDEAVQAKCDEATEDGAIVFIPAGSNIRWNGQVTWNAPNGAILRGAGMNATGGGDQTVIYDDVDVNSSTKLLNISASGAFAIEGITFSSGDAATHFKDGGTVNIEGATSLRITRCRFIASSSLNYKMLRLGGGTRGVIDHCILDFTGLNSIYLYNGRDTGLASDQAANYEWSQPTAFGSADYLFIEDNICNGDGSSRIYDGFHGSKVVVRFNTCTNICLGETHATGHAGDDRGLRSQENYGNLCLNTIDPGSPPSFTALDIKNGTALVWGNSWDQVYKSIYRFGITRQDSATYAQNPYEAVPPYSVSWGFAGPTPIAKGTVNLTGGTAVTWVSGDHFDAGWLAGTMIWIEGANAIGVSGQAPGRGPSCGIESVNSTTSITLANGGTNAADLTGAKFYVGSQWDGNTDAYGYPVLDQPGRGQGDLLVGVFPNKVNSAEGDTIAWPNQALEPVYLWNNVGDFIPGWGSSSNYSIGSAAIVENRDFYKPASGIQTNSTTPFNGTTGVGWGTLANRPTTCTPGVAYFATDQGSWNTSASNPYGVQQNGADGVLYKCTAPNTWTLYYTPYTYPHPLNVADVTPLDSTTISGSGSTTLGGSGSTTIAQ